MVFLFLIVGIFDNMYLNAEQPIGIFDSGVGGLTVVDVKTATSN